MRDQTSKAGRIWRKRRGVSAIEAGLMVGLIAVVSIATVSRIGTQVTGLFDNVNDSMASAAGTAGDNNRPPSAPQLSSTSVETLSPAGSFVGALTASDPDGDEVSFSLGQSSDDAGFVIADGNLLTAQPVDSSSQASYDITIVATDTGSPAASTQQGFTITIGPPSGGNNQAPSAPVFSGSTTQDEEQPAQTALGSVTATDPDGDGVILSLAPGGDNQYFTITSGQLRFASQLSHETPQDANGDNQYQLTLLASDTGSPPRVSSAPLTITIDNVNEPPNAALLVPHHQVPGPNSTHKRLEVSQTSSAGLFSVAPSNLRDTDPEGDSISLSITNISGHKSSVLMDKIYIANNTYKQLIYNGTRGGDASYWQELDWEEGLGCETPPNFSLPSPCPPDLVTNMADTLDACSFITITLTLTETSTPEGYTASKDFILEVMDRTNNDNQISCLRPEGGFATVTSNKPYSATD